MAVLCTSVLEEMKVSGILLGTHAEKMNLTSTQLVIWPKTFLEDRKFLLLLSSDARILPKRNEMLK